MILNHMQVGWKYVSFCPGLSENWNITALESIEIAFFLMKKESNHKLH